MIDKKAIENAVEAAKAKPAKKTYHEHDGKHPNCPVCCDMLKDIFEGDGLE